MTCCFNAARLGLLNGKPWAGAASYRIFTNVGKVRIRTSCAAQGHDGLWPILVHREIA
jgi:hypothetical protein